MSTQAQTCGIEPTRELKEWEVKSQNSSLESLTESELARHVQSQVVEEQDRDGSESTLKESPETQS